MKVTKLFKRISNGKGKGSDYYPSEIIIECENPNESRAFMDFMTEPLPGAGKLVHQIELRQVSQLGDAVLIISRKKVNRKSKRKAKEQA